jgi:hypothetical protein
MSVSGFSLASQIRTHSSFFPLDWDLADETGPKKPNDHFDPLHYQPSPDHLILAPIENLPVEHACPSSFRA